MVERDALSGELPGAPPGDRRDHRTETHLVGREGHCRQRDPRIGHRDTLTWHKELHMVPDEESVPAGLLGVLRKLRQPMWVAEITKVRQVDREPHRCTPKIA